MFWTACTMITAPLAGLFIGRLGSKKLLILGLALQALALIAISILLIENGAVFPFAYLIPTMMAAGIGMGLSFTPLSHGILSSVTEQAADEASGLSNASRELGGVFGIAIGGLIFESGNSITSAADFGHHLVPALFVLAGMLVIGFLSIVLIGSARDIRPNPDITNVEVKDVSHSEAAPKLS